MSSEITAGLERKLRSVQELLESKQYKKALKQCNQFLKKSPNPMLSCLKAFALQKLGEESEAFQLVEELMTQKPSNPNLLVLAGMVYKALGRLDRLSQIQVESFNKNPTREAGEQVFNSYASEFNFKEQYQVALKLYKTFNDAKYGLWAVDSMTLIAMHDSTQSKMLDLASLFLNKIKQNSEFGKMREVAELEIMIEEVKGRTEKVVELLSSGQSLVSDALVRRAAALEKLERFQEAFVVLESLIQDGNSDLKVFSKYGEVALRIERYERITAEQIQQNLSFKKFEEIINGELSVGVKRTARLGQFFILAQLLKENKLEAYSELLINKLVAYIRAFYEIPSVVEDTKNVLIYLNPGESEALLNSLADFNLSTFTSQSELSKILVYTKLSFKFSKVLDSHHLISLYYTSLTFEPPPKKGEHRQGDYFLLVRSLSLPSSHQVTHFELEHGVSHSTYNYFLKLQLIENLTNTEFVRKVLEIYSGLDIKSVQHESLGYLVFSELNDWRLFKAELGRILTSIEKFHKYYALDLAETTSQAYFYSHLSQVLDFAKFKEKIDKSLYFHMTQVTSLYLELVKKLQEGPVKTNTDYLHISLDQLCLNIDENVLNDYVPLNKLGEKKERFGRWSDLRFFNLDRLAAGFVCEFLYDESKAKKTLGEILGALQGLEGGEEFFVTAYGAIGDLMAGLVELKMNQVQNSEKTFKSCTEKLEKFAKSFKNFNFWTRFEQKLDFCYEGFIKDLKKVAFTANTFAPILALTLSFSKPLIPVQKSGKKGKKGADPAINSEIIQITSSLFRIFEDLLSILQNEEFLSSIDKDQQIPANLSQLLISEINQEEKTKEIMNTRRILIKDLCSELHTIKSSSSTLLNKPI